MRQYTFTNSSITLLFVDNNDIKHLFLMHFHIIIIPFQSRASTQFKVKHLGIIVLAHLHHNLKLQRSHTYLVRLLITLMIQLGLRTPIGA